MFFFFLGTWQPASEPLHCELMHNPFAERLIKNHRPECGCYSLEPRTVKELIFFSFFSKYAQLVLCKSFAALFINIPKTLFPKEKISMHGLQAPLLYFGEDDFLPLEAFKN